jgi:hypothetical protein
MRRSKEGEEARGGEEVKGRGGGQREWRVKGCGGGQRGRNQRSVEKVKRRMVKVI